MIKAIVLDIDGVIIGEKLGINCPLPNPIVMDRLKNLTIPVVLCSARYCGTMNAFTTDFDNPHIADTGVILSSAGEVIKQHPIKNEHAREIMALASRNNLYFEANSASEYYIQNDMKCEITRNVADYMRNPPITQVSSLLDVCGNDLVRIMPILPSIDEKPRVDEILRPLRRFCDITWGILPGLPYQFAMINAKEVSKRQSVLDVAEILSLPPRNMLGVGDTYGDWQFIELCGYAAAMGNATDELKEAVRSKENAYIGGHVDDNGLIDILDHFGL